MDSGEPKSPSKGSKNYITISAESDIEEIPWLILPNNLEIPCRKQRNKNKLKSFAQENITSNVTEQLSSSPVSVQNDPRVKRNTSAACQFMRKIVKEEKMRKRARRLEETFSDTDLALARGSTNFPVNHAVNMPEYPEEMQRPPSRRSIVEKGNSKSNKDDSKKNEVCVLLGTDSAVVFERLTQLQDFISEATSLCHELEMSDESAQENGAYSANGISPAGSKASNYATNNSFKDSNGLLSLKMQESLLYNMQKKDETKLSFPGHDQLHVSADDQDLANGGSFWNDENNAEPRQWTANKVLQGDAFDDEEKQLSNLKESKDVKHLHMSLERIRKRVQSMQQNSDIKNMARSLSSDDCEIGQRVAAVEFERKKLKNKLVELQEKKKMNDELLQELSYLKDAAAPSDAAKIDDCGNFPLASSRSSQCVQSKLKKRTVHTLRDADLKLSKLQTTLHHLEEMMKVLAPQQSPANESSTSEISETIKPKKDLRIVRSVVCNKHDNVRKEINGFPARRHYEAEGRANEDIDVPPATIPSRPSITTKWSPEMQDKLRQLHAAQKHVRVINSVLTSIQEAQKSGKPLSAEHADFLSTFQKGKINESQIDAYSSDSEELDYESEVPDNNPCENLSTDVKEICSNADKSELQQIEIKLSESKKHVKLLKEALSSLQECENSGKELPMEHLQVLIDLHKDKNPVLDCGSDSDVDSDAIHGNNSTEDTMGEGAGPESADGTYNMEFESARKKDLIDFLCGYNRYASVSSNERDKKSTSQIKELPPFRCQLQSFLQMSAEGRNEDVRSSGEGGYIAKQNSEGSRNSLDHVQPLHHHQDNFMLTRQNIATMESQNQSCDRNLHNRSQNAKRDNINNLSGKMEKLSIQNSVNGPFTHSNGPKDNLDSASTLSSELNQSRSAVTLSKILDYERKRRVYDRNQEIHIRSSSSVDSEPLECSNSTLAINATAAATWGGSSTQENFDEKNEDILRRQHHEGGTSGSNYDPVREVIFKSRKSAKRGPMRETTSGASAELPNSIPCASDASKDYQQQLSTHFIQQLKRQINQLNALCQEELLSEGSQTSSNFHQNCNPNLIPPCQSLHAVPDIIQPYNQQLLLCLSQCYHTLYLQQMEIQHLHHYIRHHIDCEVIRQTNALNSQGNNGEDFEFRPWCLSANSNPLIPPSNMYSNDQVSPRSSAYIPMQMKSFPSHSSTVPSNVRPVRAVIHPASQENRTAQETLNNQVPPRTRANNFWDNFRSYSRQNLLSTSNTAKRNENIGLPVAPQVRQVHPMVSNGNINNGIEIANSYSSMSSDFNRSVINPDRQLPNSRVHDLVTPMKKPNINAPSNAQCRYASFLKKEPVLNMCSSSVRNLHSDQYESTESTNPNPSSNLIQLHPNQDLSKVGNFSPICPTSATESVTSHSTTDPSNIPQGGVEYHSDFLIGLYREAKTLKSDVQRQQALKMIRDLAKSDKASENESSSLNKIRNDQAVSSNKSENVASSSSAPGTTESSTVEPSVNISEGVDSDKSISKVFETNLPWINQNLPTAAISPLSKQVGPKSTSTGAVRKKTKIQSTCFWDSLSNTQPCSFNSRENETAWDDFCTGTLQPMRENHPDFPRNVVENIILDLQAALPFGQMKEDSSDSFWSSINAYIISRIRAHMNVPLPHKSLASLRQALDHLTSEMKFCYNDGDFLKCISQFLYDSLTCFMSTGRFTSSPPFIPLSEESSVLESPEKSLDLSFKMPIETLDKTQELSINMPADEVFLPEFQTALPSISGEHCVSAPFREEIGCEWGPEAETEPEVEIGTEADLAEADQSPGQPGNVTNSSVPDADSLSAHVDQTTILLKNGPIPNNGCLVLNVIESDDSVNNSEIVMGAQCCADSCGDQEIILDDIPTKLSSSEEEPQKLDEQSNQLSPSDETIKDNNEPSTESNNSQSEVTSAK
ncbi:hypothetical protein HNY73_005713 [Argiope bruennichi]|uniref:Pericentriolar material 1 protein n=1 Tax=Argiope bruennichi TaxID=94029 RepID=A0A8T0FHJ1_ARGBR|nr:hypothetical protein HNY73_005713 [Argiope bruennichi]